MSANLLATGSRDAEALWRQYSAVRSSTEALVETLAPEDCVIQTMPDVSPTRWHLAHVTWFFEHFVLGNHAPRYKVYHEKFGFLFNSYYYSVGEMHLRPQRGFLSRPTVAEVMDYRSYVDAHMHELLQGELTAELSRLVTLGLNHEQQHQELILTDIKHVLSHNPMYPSLRATPEPPARSPADMAFVKGAEGVVETGFEGNGFCFDNETPRHKSYIHAHALSTRLVTNHEYRAFIEDGGYERSELWLSDGWATVSQQGWRRPLYWTEDCQRHYTLGGLRDIDDHAPVCHVSFYEADAYARWAGMRLPAETEWELAASEAQIEGNFVESGFLQPASTGGTGMRQLFGDVWEWTLSPYAPYPGFRPLAGALGEYNGKFMCNQMVLRGGSCATPMDHIRPTYRNFFYPHSRWQFTGIRLARD